MKTTLRRTATSFLGVLALSFVIGVGKAHAGHYEDALTQLEHAKWSGRDWHIESAIEHLESARHHLEQCRDHAGMRDAAIHEINSAIGDARKDKHERMNEH